MIHDNILIADELLHYLKSSKNGPNKGFVIKLNMSKAYNRIEWNFIKKVTLKLGFPLFECQNSWFVSTQSSMLPSVT